MNIFYDAENGNEGEIFGVFFDKLSVVSHRVDGNGDYWLTKPRDGSDNVHRPLKRLYIDHTLKENADFCKKILEDWSKLDINYVKPWYINLTTGNPNYRDGWVEADYSSLGG